MLAKAGHATVRLIHVVDETSFVMGAEGFGAYATDIFALLREGGEKTLAAAKVQVEAAGVPVETVMRDTLAGRVSTLVVDEAKAWQADLIVIGTHGRRGVNRLFMGSDAEQILRLAPVPVLLVRSHVEDDAA